MINRYNIKVFWVKSGQSPNAHRINIENWLAVDIYSLYNASIISPTLASLAGLLDELVRFCSGSSNFSHSTSLASLISSVEKWEHNTCRVLSEVAHDMQYCAYANKVLTVTDTWASPSLQLDERSDIDEDDSLVMVNHYRIRFRFYENRKGRKGQQLVNAIKQFLNVKIFTYLYWLVTKPIAFPVATVWYDNEWQWQWQWILFYLT